MPDGIRVHRWIAVALVALSLAACGRAPSPPDAATAAAPAAAAPPNAATAAPIRETTRTVVPGDTLERIFRDEGLAPSELAALRADPDLRRRIDRIVPGDELRLRIDDGRLLAF